jgi:hypothetical protein
VPFVNPVTVQDVAGAVTVHVKLPGFEETVKLVTAAPPLLTGVKKEIVACASPMAAVTPVGAFGIVDGVTAVDAKDSEEVPIPLVAVTLKVYGVPLVRLPTTHVVAGATEVHVPATLLLAS